MADHTNAPESAVQDLKCENNNISEQQKACECSPDNNQPPEEGGEPLDMSTVDETVQGTCTRPPLTNGEEQSLMGSQQGSGDGREGLQKHTEEECDAQIKEMADVTLPAKQSVFGDCPGVDLSKNRSSTLVQNSRDEMPVECSDSMRKDIVCIETEIESTNTKCEDAEVHTNGVEIESHTCTTNFESSESEHQDIDCKDSIKADSCENINLSDSEVLAADQVRNDNNVKNIQNDIVITENGNHSFTDGSRLDTDVILDEAAADEDSKEANMIENGDSSQGNGIKCVSDEAYDDKNIENPNNPASIDDVQTEEDKHSEIVESRCSESFTPAEGQTAVPDAAAYSIADNDQNKESDQQEVEKYDVCDTNEHKELSTATTEVNDQSENCKSEGLDLDGDEASVRTKVMGDQCEQVMSRDEGKSDNNSNIISVEPDSSLERVSVKPVDHKRGDQIEKADASSSEIVDIFDENPQNDVNESVEHQRSPYLVEETSETGNQDDQTNDDDNNEIVEEMIEVIHIENVSIEDDIRIVDVPGEDMKDEDEIREVEASVPCINLSEDVFKVGDVTEGSKATLYDDKQLETKESDLICINSQVSADDQRLNSTTIEPDNGRKDHGDQEMISEPQTGQRSMQQGEGLHDDEEKERDEYQVMSHDDNHDLSDHDTVTTVAAQGDRINHDQTDLGVDKDERGTEFGIADQPGFTQKIDQTQQDTSDATFLIQNKMTNTNEAEGNDTVTSIHDKKQENLDALKTDQLTLRKTMDEQQRARGCTNESVSTGVTDEGDIGTLENNKTLNVEPIKIEQPRKGVAVDFLQVVGVASKVYTSSDDSSQRKPVANVQIIDANDLVFSDDDNDTDDLCRSDPSASYEWMNETKPPKEDNFPMSQDIDDPNMEKFHSKHKVEISHNFIKDDFEQCHISEQLIDTDGGLKGLSHNYEANEGTDDIIGGEIAPLSSIKEIPPALDRGDNLLNYIDSKYDFESGKFAYEGNTRHYQLYDESTAKESAESVTGSDVDYNVGKEHTSQIYSTPKKAVNEQLENRLKLQESDTVKGFENEARHRHYFSDLHRNQERNVEEALYREVPDIITSPSNSSLRKTDYNSSYKDHEEYSRSYDHNIHDEPEDEMPSYSEMYTGSYVHKVHTDNRKQTSEENLSLNPDVKDSLSYGDHKEDLGRPNVETPPSFSRRNVLGESKYHSSPYSRSPGLTSPKPKSSSFSSPVTRSTHVTANLTLTPPMRSETPRDHTLAIPYELTSPLIKKSTNKDDPSSKLLAELEERHLQAMEEVEHQITSQTSSQLSAAEFASHVRCNLREKHSRHLADLRLFYEDEVASLKRQMTSAAYVMSQPTYQELQHQFEQLKVKCNYLEGEVNTANKIIKERENQVRSLQIRLREWPDRYETAQSVQKNLQHQLDQLRSYSADQEKQIQSLESTVQQMTSVHHEAQKLQHDDVIKIRQEQAASQKLQTEVTALQHENHILQSNLHDTDTKLQDSRSQTTELKRNITRLELEVTRLGRENDVLHHKAMNSSLRGTCLDTSGLSDSSINLEPKRDYRQNQSRSLHSSPVVKNQTIDQQNIHYPSSNISINVVPVSPVSVKRDEEIVHQPLKNQDGRQSKMQTYDAPTDVSRTQTPQKAVFSPVKSPVRVTDTLTARAVSNSSRSPLLNVKLSDILNSPSKSEVRTSREKSPARSVSDHLNNRVKKTVAAASPSRSVFRQKTEGATDKGAAGIYTIRASADSPTMNQTEEGCPDLKSSSKSRIASSAYISTGADLSNSKSQSTKDTQNSARMSQKGPLPLSNARNSVNNRDSSTKTSSLMMNIDWDSKKSDHKNTAKSSSKSVSERGRPRGTGLSSSAPNNQKASANQQLHATRSAEGKKFEDQPVASDITVQTAIERVKAGVYITQPTTSVAEPKRRKMVNKAESRLQDIAKLENNMKALSLEKTKLESVLSRIPLSHSMGITSWKARQEKERVESQLDAVDSQLGKVRMALKKYHAL